MIFIVFSSLSLNQSCAARGCSAGGHLRARNRSIICCSIRVWHVCLHSPNISKWMAKQLADTSRQAQCTFRISDVTDSQTGHDQDPQVCCAHCIIVIVCLIFWSRRQLLATTAQRLGFRCVCIPPSFSNLSYSFIPSHQILTGDCGTMLAIRTLTNVSLGRGASVSSDAVCSCVFLFLCLLSRI